MHPFNGDDIAVNYINKAVSIEDDSEKIKSYKETISMIREQLLSFVNLENQPDNVIMLPRDNTEFSVEKTEEARYILNF